MARPLKPIDPRQVELLAGCGCTVDEIGAKLGVSDVTLRKRFLPVIENGRRQGIASLRGKQFERAMKGSDTMLIWLGKQLLGQSDKLDSNVNHSGSIEHKEADEESVLAAADAIRCRRERLPTLS